MAFECPRCDLLISDDAGREAVAQWMIKHGYATGHGDTIEDMLGELEAQAKEKRDGNHPAR